MAFVELKAPPKPSNWVSETAADIGALRSKPVTRRTESENPETAG